MNYSSNRKAYLSSVKSAYFRGLCPVKRSIHSSAVTSSVPIVQPLNSLVTHPVGYGEVGSRTGEDADKMSLRHRLVSEGRMILEPCPKLRRDDAKGLSGTKDSTLSIRKTESSTVSVRTPMQSTLYFLHMKL